MARLGLETSVVDQSVYQNTVARFREAGVLLPTYSQLKDPSTIPASIRAKLKDVDPDTPHPLNLFRVHWFNDANRTGVTDVPEHIELPSELTGVKARIVLALGNKFPMINAHKVLAAYGCLVPRVVTGQFDPTRQKAVWPSTGNYCRGGAYDSALSAARLIQRMGAGRAAYTSVLIPVIAMLISTLAEGYRWSGLAVPGALLAIAGMVIALRAKTRA